MIADIKTNRADHDSTPKDWFWNTKSLPDCTDEELVDALLSWTQMLDDCLTDIRHAGWVHDENPNWPRWLKHIEERAHKLEIRAGFLRMVRKEQDRRAEAKLEDWPPT